MKILSIFVCAVVSLLLGQVAFDVDPNLEWWRRLIGVVLVSFGGYMTGKI